MPEAFPPFVFLGSLPVLLNRPLVPLNRCSPGLLHRSLLLLCGRGVVWGQGMIQSEIWVTDKADVNSVTDFGQHPCLPFVLKHSSSLLQGQERRNKPLCWNRWLWTSLVFPPQPHTFKYSGFIVLKDVLCEVVFQKAEGLRVLNMCSGVLGAPLTT